MSIKPDHWIRKMALEHGMIEPFVDKQTTEGAISYGVSAYGYDIRVSDEFKVFTDVFNTVVDPKSFDEKSFVTIVDKECIIPPNSFALARTVEFFRIPRSTITVCVGKSTYARCGIIVNTTPLPAKIYANEGIAQVLFFESDEECEVSYADKKGKYQSQTGITLPRMKD